MLQQTRVAAAIPYYGRFLRAFPNVRALARAPLSRVLALWSGLGYYGRARNLHRAAREIIGRLGGRFPKTRDELLSLPGFGRYTAGAVASIAFEEPVPVVDGNVARVYSRWFGWKGDATSPALRKRTWERATALVPALRPGDWNQSVMELGALVCVPQGPRCDACPVRRGCRALASGRPGSYGGRRAPAARPREHRTWLVVNDSSGRIALWRRPATGIWGGLYEFPSLEGRLGVAGALRHASRMFGVPPTRLAGRAEGDVHHVFTHKEVTFRIVRMTAAIRPSSREFRWLTPRAAEALGLPTPVREVLSRMSRFA